MPLSKEKRKSIEKLKSDFVKEFKLGKDVKMGFLSDCPDLGRIEHLPTGIIGFDVLTNGGWVKNKINMLFGGESAGKTTLLLNSMGSWQKTFKDFLAAYIPAEKNFDREWAAANGCSEDMMWLFEPKSTEENLDFVMRCGAEGSPVNALIIDTLQALSSEKEMENNKGQDKSVGDSTMAVLPRLYSQFLRMYTAKTEDTLTLILTSQVRTDLNPMAHGANKATGGNALKHYNMLNIQMRRSDYQKEWPSSKMPPNSYVCTLKIEKAKIKDRYKNNVINIYFYKGSFEHKFNVLAIAKDFEMFKDDTLTFKNKEGVEETVKFEDFEDMYEKISNEMLEQVASQLQEKYTQIVMNYKPVSIKTEEDEDE